ncbi:MAG TPA: HipA family kinase [Longimicrobiaceae bacterium]|nr:HipA family kinase [Longimicrobiaceae bacterium]
MASGSGGTSLPHLPALTATQYVQPLREGGSLPAIVDTDGGLFVVKFRGAGQGEKALVAELIVGQLARALGLLTPELAIVELPEAFGRSEPDPEIQDLLRASRGVNVGLRFLEGAFNFDPAAAGEVVTPDLAAGVVWLDAFLTNPDRTHRNPNLLVWNRQPWLIDHGAALYAHHNWDAVDEAKARTPFPLIEKHVLLTLSGSIADADARAGERITPALLADVLGRVPDVLLAPGGDAEAADAARRRYLDYLATRLRAPRLWVDEAAAARERVLREPPRALRARR